MDYLFTIFSIFASSSEILLLGDYFLEQLDFSIAYSLKISSWLFSFLIEDGLAGSFF
jgi:hypothetical protein